MNDDLHFGQSAPEFQESAVDSPSPVVLPEEVPVEPAANPDTPPTVKEIADNHEKQALEMIAEANTMISEAANGTQTEQADAYTKAQSLLKDAGRLLLSSPSVVPTGLCPLEANDAIPANDPGEGFVGVANSLDSRLCMTPGCGRIAPDHWFIQGNCHIALRKGVVTNDVVSLHKP